MDNLKIFHVRSKGVDEVLSHLIYKYGNVSELSASLGSVHDYLGMWLNYGTKGKVHINMPKHIKIILEAAAEDMNGITKTPAANHMFTVRVDGDTLMGT